VRSANPDGTPDYNSRIIDMEDDEDEVRTDAEPPRELSPLCELTAAPVPRANGQWRADAPRANVRADVISGGFGSHSNKS
jgi:hypothetical protein